MADAAALSLPAPGGQVPGAVIGHRTFVIVCRNIVRAGSTQCFDDALCDNSYGGMPNAASASGRTDTSMDPRAGWSRSTINIVTTATIRDIINVATRPRFSRPPA